MANTIITKNSSTASAVPSAVSLTQGELAVNVTDKKLYTKDSGGSVVEITPTNITGTTTASIVTSALASGTADSSTYLRGDRTWQTISTTPTTDQVLTATAGATAGAVGTYAFMYDTSAVTLSYGATVAGSRLKFANNSDSSGFDSPSDVDGSSTSTASGTWRLMGSSGWRNSSSNTSKAFRHSVWLRIS